MFRKYAEPLVPYGTTLLRIMIGFTMFMNGQSKLLGAGPLGMVKFLSSLGVPLPELFSVIITLLEPIGGLLLMVGLGTRVLGLLFTLEMLVTTLIVKMPQLGFIAAPNKGAGAELDLVILAGAFTLFILGPGLLSLDNVLFRAERLQPAPRLQTSP